MKIKELQWQGEPIKIRFGFMGVSTNKEKPLYWYNYECRDNGYAAFLCIEIKQHGQTWYIDNSYNYGIKKLRAGGWPNHGHKSLPDNTFAFTEVRDKGDIAIMLESEFDEESFAEDEAKREKWIKENFSNHPDYSKMIAARKMAQQRVFPKLIPNAK